MKHSKITDQLWISDIHAVREGSTKTFDRVMTVCQDSVEDNVGCEYDYFNMSDGKVTGLVPGDDSYELFAQAVECLIRALERGEVVLVHCHAGRSRSAAVSIAALATINDQEYFEAYGTVRDGRGFVHPDKHLVDHARRYIKSARETLGTSDY